MSANTTTEFQLLISDQAIMQNLALAAVYRNRAALEVAEGGPHAAQAAQRAAEHGFKVEALTEVARATGAFRRHKDVADEAIEGYEGCDTVVFDYFFNAREDLKAEQEG